MQAVRIIQHQIDYPKRQLPHGIVSHRRFYIHLSVRNMNMIFWKHAQSIKGTPKNVFSIASHVAHRTNHRYAKGVKEMWTIQVSQAKNVNFPDNL